MASMTATMSKTPMRFSASPLELLRNAAGTPREFGEKLLRLAAVLRTYADGKALDAQLVVGAVDMMRFWIVPCAEDYYRSKGIDFTFHQVLRFLDEPASLADPTGFMSTPDNIIGHLLQVVHANPAYDFQLLESHERGLDELESQTLAMIEGRHPRARSILAIVEEPDYHEKLLAFVREYKRTRDADAPLRDNVATNPRFRKLEETFGTLPRAMAYFSRLPKTPLSAARHLLFVKTFPESL